MKELPAVRHKNIPIFIPHLGCPHDCVFCNQKKISGHASFDTSRVRNEIEESLSTIKEGERAEIAFFGGSFTGIGIPLMTELLDIASEYVDKRELIGIRMSTRPDYISREILDILKNYKISAIELGLQSFDDNVLTASERGHTSECSINACRLIKEYGFTLVGQMMVGLPGATPESELDTVRKIASLGCVAARVYPTVVFKGTKLAKMAESGMYIPLTNDEAVKRTAGVLKILTDAKITLLRVGLCSNEDIRDPGEAICGATHPAIGELCMGELYYNIIRERLSKACAMAEKNIPVATVYVKYGEISKAVGHKKLNSRRLYDEFCRTGKIEKIKFAQSDELLAFDAKIKITDR